MDNNININTNTNNFLGTAEAADYLGISIGTVKNLVKWKKITYYKPIKKLLFKKSDLDKYLEGVKNV